MTVDKFIVVISKQWDAPIEIKITNTEIGISMPLSEFLDALVVEAGNPMMLITVARLRTRLEKAARAVCEQMKQETARRASW